MRFYLIHILAKDLAFFVVYFLAKKFTEFQDFRFQTEWYSMKEILGLSAYWMVGVALIDLIVYFVINRFLRKRDLHFHGFLFGVFLHFLTMLNMIMFFPFEKYTLPFWSASMISTLISGFVYLKLNKERLIFCGGYEIK